MVQYIFTPWRDRHELLRVRQLFYPNHYEHELQHTPVQSAARSTQKTQHGGSSEQHRGVARVSMWMQRGNCPHLVESTALLTAAILSDHHQVINAASSALRAVAGSAVSSSSYAVRAAYSAAFSRFVTGLLDGHQDKQRKMSMYGVARSVGLPATFVELRHQATHEQLPSLTRLRAAARKALDWIWDYYWKHLPADAIDTPNATTGMGDTVVDLSCRSLLLRYLQDEGEKKTLDLLGQARAMGEATVLIALNSIADGATDGRLLARAVALSRTLLASGRQNDRADGSSVQDIDHARADLHRSWQEMRDLASEPSCHEDASSCSDPAHETRHVSGWSRFEEDDGIGVRVRDKCTLRFSAAGQDTLSHCDWPHDSVPIATSMSFSTRRPSPGGNDPIDCAA